MLYLDTEWKLKPQFKIKKKKKKSMFSKVPPIRSMLFMNQKLIFYFMYLILQRVTFIEIL